MTGNICNNVYLAAIKQAPLNTLRLMRWWSYTSSFSVSVSVWHVWCNTMKLISWPSYFLNLKERKVLIKYACAQILGFQNEIRRVQQEKIPKKNRKKSHQKIGIKCACAQNPGLKNEIRRVQQQLSAKFCAFLINVSPPMCHLARYSHSWKKIFFVSWKKIYFLSVQKIIFLSRGIEKCYIGWLKQK